MRLMAIIAVAALAVVTLASTRPAADEPKKVEASPDIKLVGTWTLVSAKYGGEDYQFPEGTTTLKHVTPEQFMWVTYGKDGKLTRAAGGSYTLKGDQYEETPEYGYSSSFDVLKGKVQSFTWKVDGNTWHHDGKLSNGLTIEEVWKRVEKK